MVRGFEQVQGADYAETFAPVVKYSSVRALCAEVAAEDLEFGKMDAKAVFLNGEIYEDIYIEVPENVDIPADDFVKLGLSKVGDIEKLDYYARLKNPCTGQSKLRGVGTRKIIQFFLANSASLVPAATLACTSSVLQRV